MDTANELTIKLNLDATAARAAADDQKAGFRKIAAAADDAARAIQGDFDKAGSAVGAASGQTATMLNKLQSLAGATAPVAAVVGAMQSYLNVIRQANEQARQQLEQLNQTKNIIRDIAAMQGQTPTDRYTLDFLKFNRTAGLSQESGKAFLQEFIGAGESAKGVNISERGYNQFRDVLGQFAALQGGGPEAAGTYGKLGGLLLGLGHYKSADEALVPTMQFIKQISAGVGDNPELVRKAAEVAGTFMDEHGKGQIRNATELGAITATASRVSPKQAAEIMRMSGTLLSGFGEEYSGMLKMAGITADDKQVDAYLKMFKLLEGVEKSGRRVDLFMQGQGVGTELAQRFQAMYNYRGFFRNQLAAGAAPMTGEDARKELAARLAADSGVQLQQLRAGTEMERMQNAMPDQFLLHVEELAKQRLEKQGFGPASAAGKSLAFRLGAANLGNIPLPLGLGSVGFAGSNEELGQLILRDQEMARIAAERGLKLAGRPENIYSPLGGASKALGGLPGFNAAYLGYLTGGGAEAAYSTLGSTLQLGQAGKGFDGKDLVAALDRNTQATEAQNRQMGRGGNPEPPNRPMRPIGVPRGNPRR